MRYATVCSGIEAPTVAWKNLGWQPAWFAENDAFPSAVLAERHPGVPNLGDITKFHDWPDAAIDLLIGGTPCQSFSVAGLRKGLDDPRGNLMLVYLAIARRYRPCWLVWENVPGVLSVDGGRAFGTLLGGLAELGYGFAYRILDAQYIGVPQRRRRVFVVGYLGDWRRAAAVLFERQSLSWDSPPSRKAGEDVARTIAARTKAGGGLGTDLDCDGGLVAHPLLAKGNCSFDGTLETYVAHSLRADGFDASEDGTGHGTPIVAFAQNQRQEVRELEVAGACQSIRRGDAKNETLLAFDSKASGRNGFAVGDQAPTLRAMGHKDTHSNAGGQVAVAFTERTRADGRNFEAQEDIAYALTNPGSGGRTHSRQLMTPAMQIRRLTPRECERLQGFEDDYTLITYRGKLAKDGPRYKALGNSMAVPVIRWLGERIGMVEARTRNLSRNPDLKNASNYTKSVGKRLVRGGGFEPPRQ